VRKIGDGENYASKYGVFFRTAGAPRIKKTSNNIALEKYIIILGSRYNAIIFFGPEDAPDHKVHHDFRWQIWGKIDLHLKLKHKIAVQYEVSTGHRIP
jgi:hypothetical protein